jgi:hypothetical protein
MDYDFRAAGRELAFLRLGLEQQPSSKSTLASARPLSWSYSPLLSRGDLCTRLWLLWRRSLEPLLGIRVTMLISMAYWTPFFYIPFVLPSSTWWAGRPGTEVYIHGQIVYPNLLVAAFFLSLTRLVQVLIKRRLANSYPKK